MRKVLGILFVLSILCLFRALAADYGTINLKDEVDYDKFFSLQDNYKLVMKDNDLYVYNIDGTNKRRITHSPKFNKPMASFAKDRSYIIYAQYSQEGANGGELKYYRVKFEEDDNRRSPILKEEYDALSKQ